MPFGGAFGEVVAALAAPAHEVIYFNKHRPVARLAARPAARAVEGLARLGVGGRFVLPHELRIKGDGVHSGRFQRLLGWAGAGVKLC
jgi:hypothetical protein